MTNKICACCGQLFEPRPQVPNQTYCSLPTCQRTRRQRWQRGKMQNDPDYRDNQTRNQRAWLDRNPEYWRNYREINPEYVERNKSRQRSKRDLQQEQDIAKMDASLVVALQPGIYLIRPVTSDGFAKSDAWLVEIMPVCLDCPCKKDACKDRT